MRVVKAMLSKLRIMLFLALLGNFARKRIFYNNFVDHGGVYLLFFYPLRYLNCMLWYVFSCILFKYKVLLFTMSS